MKTDERYNACGERRASATVTRACQPTSSVRRSRPGQPMNTASWAASGTPHPDRGRGDPEVRVVRALMETVADDTTSIAELRGGFDRLGIHGEEPRSGCELREPAQPYRSPVRLQRAVAGLGHGLRSYEKPLAEEVLRVRARQRRLLAQPRREHVRVEQNGAGHSWSAATNSAHSSSVMPGISKLSSDRSGSRSATSSAKGGRVPEHGVRFIDRVGLGGSVVHGFVSSNVVYARPRWFLFRSSPSVLTSSATWPNPGPNVPAALPTDIGRTLSKRPRTAVIHGDSRPQSSTVAMAGVACHTGDRPWSPVRLRREAGGVHHFSIPRMRVWTSG